ncbi:TraR/DksA C4-type zinc finger protein [Paenisporosarcina sp. FSL H8-0542]|uniref:TraR/DksA C4-type zinc finger protein n=1 Tax=Paenisporosarcina sp. FSL H8-0542 TaxID=2921401 RepID=UPI00315A8DB2
MNDQQLKQLKDQLTQDLEDVKNRLHEDHHLETTELSNYDNHPADNATDLTDQNTEMAIEHHKEEEVEQIESALQAIENGTYGICTVCGEDIPFERLEALPTARTCIEHANHDFGTDGRPSEEDILGSSTEHPIKDTGGVRDYEDSFDDVKNFGTSDSPQDAVKSDQKNFYKK